MYCFKIPKYHFYIPVENPITMPGGSGYANYQDATNNKYGEPHVVPLKMATEESIKDYGRIVRSFEDEAVWITPWPVNGWRPLYPGTGQDGGITSGEFRCSWKDDLCTAQNEAVGGDYVTGRLPNDVSCKNRTYVLTQKPTIILMVDRSSFPPTTMHSFWF